MLGNQDYYFRYVYISFIILQCKVYVRKWRSLGYYRQIKKLRSSRSLIFEYQMLFWRDQALETESWSSKCRGRSRGGGGTGQRGPGAAQPRRDRGVHLSGQGRGDRNIPGCAHSGRRRTAVGQPVQTKTGLFQFCLYANEKENLM